MAIKAPNLDSPTDGPAYNRALPVAHNLTLVYVSSAIIALALAVISLAGILLRDVVYPTDELVLSFLITDGFTLIVALPILLVSMWLARRGRLIGLLCWPGALFYVLYIHVVHLIGVPFNLLFLPYLLLVTLSAYTIIGLIASIDAAGVRTRLSGHVPAKAAGGIVTILSALFLVQLVPAVVMALTGQSPVKVSEIALWIADSTLAPAWLIGGILLWRREALGYVAGAGLLLVYTVLFLGTLPVMLFPAFYSDAPVDAAGLAIMAMLGLICLVTFLFYAHGVLSSSGSSAGAGPAPANKKVG